MKSIFTLTKEEYSRRKSRNIVKTTAQRGEVKYKIIDVDGSDLDIDTLLDKYYLMKTTIPLALSS